MCKHLEPVRLPFSADGSVCGLRSTFKNQAVFKSTLAFTFCQTLLCLLWARLQALSRSGMCGFLGSSLLSPVHACYPSALLLLSHSVSPCVKFPASPLPYYSPSQDHNPSLVESLAFPFTCHWDCYLLLTSLLLSASSFFWSESNQPLAERLLVFTVWTVQLGWCTRWAGSGEMEVPGQNARNFPFLIQRSVVFHEEMSLVKIVILGCWNS